ncbi:MFS transporter [Yersinia pseudotuberculosis]|uniref:MFS superfamliy multidrug-efflux transporter n=1 Tax=Yersinia pseudotuberculosis TaxID=633 RepID=A0A380SCE8_YERPU|nr:MULTISPECIES: MFS transporter [Yersinia pseudotuberculosis complex]MBO1552097.1 MFS transporter [Yersinia pseudotuberculosis]MBO1572303.1 MFS transporter [Yersinia pseudotuberculosis]MBO1587193.1 MFS transporter [Yersinia pseudotuberculosis]MBO1636741.1 MFS transporter [Yersinia pseudotuberculosis]PSH19721.1 MFS transporter [Yersinia pseudotuberculosis]
MNQAGALAITYGSYNSIRMLIGVYHAIFLISAGVTLPQLALLQVVFSATILLLDFPFAVLADRYRRKYSVVAGVLLTGLFYPLCLQAPDMVALILSEIFYAAGICLITGAIDGWVFHSLGEKQDSFSHYAHLCQRVSSVGSVIAGVIGIGTIYLSGQYHLGYIISSIMMLIIFISFIMIKEEKRTQPSHIEKKSILQNATETLWIFKNTVGGKWFILLICFFSTGIQIIYHFWQPIILAGKNFTKIDDAQMLILMFCHVGAFSAQYFSNSLMSKYHVADEKYKKTVKYFSFISALMCVFLYLFVNNNNTVLAIIAFSLIHGFICAVPIGAKSLFFSELNPDQTNHVSGLVGAVSFSGRIFSIAVLSIISLLPDNLDPSYYLVVPAVSFLLCGIVFIKWMTIFRK